MRTCDENPKLKSLSAVQTLDVSRDIRLLHACAVAEKNKRCFSQASNTEKNRSFSHRKTSITISPK